MVDTTVHPYSDLVDANSFVLQPPFESIELNRKLTRVDRRLLTHLMKCAQASDADAEDIQTIDRTDVYQVLECQTDPTVIHVLRKLGTTLVELKEPQGWKMGMFLSYTSLKSNGDIKFLPVFANEINWHSGERGTAATITGAKTEIINLD